MVLRRPVSAGVSIHSRPFGRETLYFSKPRFVKRVLVTFREPVVIPSTPPIRDPRKVKLRIKNQTIKFRANHRAIWTALAVRAPSHNQRAIEIDRAKQPILFDTHLRRLRYSIEPQVVFGFVNLGQ